MLRYNPFKYNDEDWLHGGFLQRADGGCKSVKAVTTDHFGVRS